MTKEFYDLFIHIHHNKSDKKIINVSIVNHLVNRVVSLISDKYLALKFMEHSIPRTRYIYINSKEHIEYITSKITIPKNKIKISKDFKLVNLNS